MKKGIYNAESNLGKVIYLGEMIWTLTLVQTYNFLSTVMPWHWFRYLTKVYFQNPPNTQEALVWVSMWKNFCGFLKKILQK